MTLIMTCRLVGIVLFFVLILIDGRHDFCKKMCWNGEIELSCKCKGQVEHCRTYETNWSSFRRDILTFHNRVRSAVANGKLISYGFPAASNMVALSYDYELEYTARCHAKQCLMEHNDCASTSKFYNTGQNIFLTKKPFLVMMREGYSHGMLEDFSRSFDPEAAQKLIDDFHYEYKIALFTQMIWAKTTHIGCWQVSGAIRKYLSVQDEIPIQSDGKKPFMMTCNYGPGGNFVEQPIYERGPPGTNCPNGTKPNEDKNFYGLCGEQTIPQPPVPTAVYGFDDPIGGTPQSYMLNCILVAMTIIVLLQ